MSAESGRDRSGYLRFVPPVLWDTGADPGGFSLNQLLLVAEKLLTGIDDDEVVRHRPGAGGLAEHTHDGIEAVIDRLDLLLHPHRTLPRFLPWLAGWVGVELPEQWSEQQQRRLIAEMVPALGQRGLVDGLNRFLDLYTVPATRPRIALDEGAHILFTTPTPGRPAPVHALLSHGPYVRNRARAVYPGLAQPQCVAATPGGDLLIGDNGVTERLDGRVNPAVPVVPVGPGIWRVGRAGDYLDSDSVGPDGTPLAGPPRPRPIGRTVVHKPPAGGGPAAAGQLRQPKAIRVVGDAASWQAYVVDSDALYRLRSGEPDSLRELLTAQELQGLFILDDLALDGPDHLLVLGGDTVVPVDLTDASPRVGNPHRLDGVQPGSLLVHGGQLLVGDVRSQAEVSEQDEGDRGPADLVLVDRRNPNAWRLRRLLTQPADNPFATVERNPLVAPVALAADGPDHLLVLDAGLRPLVGGASFPFTRVRAEQAAVHRLTLDHPGDPDRLAVMHIERVTEPGRLTWPTGMVLIDGTAYVTDPGEPTEAAPLFRDGPGGVATVVHFVKGSTVPLQQQRALVHDIANVVDAHRPASTAIRPPHSPSDIPDG